MKTPAKAAVEGCFGLVASETLIAVPSPVGGASGAALMFIPVDNTRINRLQVTNAMSLHVCFHRLCALVFLERLWPGRLRVRSIPLESDRHVWRRLPGQAVGRPHSAFRQIQSDP